MLYAEPGSRALSGEGRVLVCSQVPLKENPKLTCTCSTNDGFLAVFSSPLSTMRFAVLLCRLHVIQHRQRPARPPAAAAAAPPASERVLCMCVCERQKERACERE